MGGSASLGTWRDDCSIIIFIRLRFVRTCMDMAEFIHEVCNYVIVSGNINERDHLNIPPYAKAVYEHLKVRDAIDSITLDSAHDFGRSYIIATNLTWKTVSSLVDTVTKEAVMG